jgi:hypothetical protein
LILSLALVVTVAVEGCKRKEPEPIPGPKAVNGPRVSDSRTPGIAYFQGGFEEAFAQADTPHSNCRGEYMMAAPRAPEVARTRKHLDSPPPAVVCSMEPCPPTARHPRHRLV